MDKLDEIKLTLENERGFYEEFTRKLRLRSPAAELRNVILGWKMRTLPDAPTLLSRHYNELVDYFIERYSDEIPAAFKPKQLPKEEEPMNHVDETKAVQTVTYVYGKPIQDVSDDRIFGYIAECEREIKALEGIEHKPKKLVAKIEALKAEIQLLIDTVDNRD